MHKVVFNDINNAIDSIVNPGGAAYNNSEDDEFDQWKRCEPQGRRSGKMNPD
jgi:hypothetical protein